MGWSQSRPARPPSRISPSISAKPHQSKSAFLSAGRSQSLPLLRAARQYQRASVLQSMSRSLELSALNKLLLLPDLLLLSRQFQWWLRLHLYSLRLLPSYLHLLLVLSFHPLLVNQSLPQQIFSKDNYQTLYFCYQRTSLHSLIS